MSDYERFNENFRMLETRTVDLAKEIHELKESRGQIEIRLRGIELKIEQMGRVFAKMKDRIKELDGKEVAVDEPEEEKPATAEDKVG